MSANLGDVVAGGAACLAPPVFAPLCIQEIIRRHHTSLLTFLRRRLATPDDALDVAQEAYMRMMRYEGSQTIESPTSMLFRIATNVAADHGRAAQTRHCADHLEIESVELASEQPSAERTVAAQQSLELLFAAIDGLPPKCREVFLLSREQDMTYPQIARHCGISVKMVEKHVSHALAVCLAKIGRGKDAGLRRKAAAWSARSAVLS